MQPDDSILIQQILNGDQSAFAQLVDRHRQTAFGIAVQITGNREDAEEIAMDAFVKVYQSLRGFKGEARFSTWLYRIVYNTAISFKRRKRTETLPMNDYLVENFSEDDFGHGLHQLDIDDQARLVKMVMDSLPGEDAALMDLFYRNELSIEEISQITSLTVSNVKVKLHRIRKRIYAGVQALVKKENAPVQFNITWNN